MTKPKRIDPKQDKFLESVDLAAKRLRQNVYLILGLAAGAVVIMALWSYQQSSIRARDQEAWTERDRVVKASHGNWQQELTAYEDLVKKVEGSSAEFAATIDLVSKLRKSTRKVDLERAAQLLRDLKTRFPGRADQLAITLPILEAVEAELKFQPPAKAGATDTSKDSSATPPPAAAGGQAAPAAGIPAAAPAATPPPAAATTPSESDREDITKRPPP